MHAVFSHGFFIFFSHDIKGFFPANRLKFALFVKFAFFVYAKKRLSDTVGAVHNFSVKITLDAV